MFAAARLLWLEALNNIELTEILCNVSLKDTLQHYLCNIRFHSKMSNSAGFISIEHLTEDLLHIFELIVMHVNSLIY